jgi:hypothetical protein
MTNTSVIEDVNFCYPSAEMPAHLVLTLGSTSIKYSSLDVLAPTCPSAAPL